MQQHSDTGYCSVRLYKIREPTSVVLSSNATNVRTHFFSIQKEGQVIQEYVQVHIIPTCKETTNANEIAQLLIV